MRTCAVDLLCEVDSLPVGQTTDDGRSRGWSQRGVEGVDVEAQVDRSPSSVRDHGQRFQLPRRNSIVLKQQPPSRRVLWAVPGQKMLKRGFHDFSDP